MRPTPASAQPDSIEAEIDTLQDIDRLLGSMRSTRSDRIDAMQADLDGHQCPGTGGAPGPGAG